MSLHHETPRPKKANGKSKKAKRVVAAKSSGTRARIPISIPG